MRPLKYIDDVPGSLYLVDEGHEANLLHGDGKRKEIILDPTPSLDVNDPLNWTPKRKMLAVSCVYVYTTFYGFSGCVIYSLIVAINKDTGIPVTTLIQGTGYLFGLLGWFGPFILPMSFRYGARPGYIFSQLVQVFVCVWSPYIRSSGEWLASRVIQGATGCAIETLVEISIAQIFFSHERGTYIGIYSFLLFGSNYLAPAISGFVYEGIGWKWTMFWAAFVALAGLVYLIIFQEETNFNRHLAPGYHGPEVAVLTEDAPTPDSDSASKEKADPLANVVSSSSERQLVGTPKSFWAKLKVYNGTFLGWKETLTCMWRSWWLIFRFPLILWAGFQYGLSLVTYNILNATLAPILSAPPYNFSTAVAACMYYAPLIGVFLGGMIAGKFGDVFALMQAKKNGGIREPEQKLALMGISAIFVPAGLILWGVGAAHNVHWMGLAFGIGFIGFTNGISATTCLGYALDCYRELGTEVMIGVIIVRNTLSFAIGYGISPWIAGLGQQNAFISAAFIFMGLILTFIPVMKIGKKIRVAQKDAYWWYAKRAVLEAH